MPYENENTQIPQAGENILVEESLQMEELEPRVAPNTVWGD